MRFLRSPERRAIRLFISRVLNEVPARLVEAALFGSTARGEAQPGSDLDILLVYRSLPVDREPQAGIAERIAREVALRSDVPITVWTVAECDLIRGNRTPMLVDALEDAIPLWCRTRALRPVPFTPEDARWCTLALLARVAEGSRAFEAHRAAGRPSEAARRCRDDLVRLCTAILLLRGVTRPRRADAIVEAARILFAHRPPPPFARDALEWATRSFGPSGRDEGTRLVAPLCGFDSVLLTVDFLRDRVVDSLGRAACYSPGDQTRKGVYKPFEGTSLARFRTSQV